ncbi:CBS domain-containing protein [Halogranum gelatinilyticum]|uniref:CBS domain-containing protein n=1 Tax=Halogranum gelatinilyticum TaxID=660521 RepID=A0A1G9ZGV1_9EURY|nr:CBS domain-containing protein [Halogranum gelatinilyticum]SDN20539.1 CBS domain-containing protein [Halogranum gelatinilyticum]
MSLERIGRTDVVTVGVDSPVDEVVETMRSHNVGCVVVVDGGRPRGIVTDRDLVLYAMDGSEALTARNVMAEDLFTVDIGDDVFDVVNELCERGVRRAPVLERGDLVGIVTLDDFVRLLATELDRLADVIEAESPRL